MSAEIVIVFIFFAGPIRGYSPGQQFTKGTRSKPNQQLFPAQVVIQLPNIY